MIYGIKQIEKQFPGFEAQWVGGQLFDLRCLFEKYNDMEKREDIVEFSNNIVNEFPDTLIPPCKKMYIIKGNGLIGTEQEIKYEISRNKRFHLYTEYAIQFEEDEKIKKLKEEYPEYPGFIAIKKIYVSDFYKYPNITVVKRYLNFITSPKGAPLAAKAYTYARPVGFLPLIQQIFGKICARNFLESKHTEAEALYLAHEDLAVATADIRTALFYLNVRNIKQRPAYISRQRDFYYPKAWGREYKVLSLSQTLTEHSPGPDLPPGYHVRGHFQRGHFKRKPSGVYWWNSHWRGDFSKGIVMKDYKA